VEKLKKAEQVLVRAEGAVLVAILSLMITLAFLQVALRQVFHSGILWGDTLARHLVLWVGFLGAALAASDGKHFAWEAASHKSGKAGAAMRLAAQLFAASISGYLTSAAWTFLLDEKTSGGVLLSIGPLALRGWLMAAAIPAGFLLVLLHSLVRAAEAAAELRK
jgi:TRAP-type C4-dicarboxylate transport system permease small subunit